MTIDEAIKELQDEVDEHPQCGELPYYKALKLSIEIMQYIQLLAGGVQAPPIDYYRVWSTLR